MILAAALRCVRPSGIMVRAPNYEANGREFESRKAQMFM